MQNFFKLFLYNIFLVFLIAFFQLILNRFSNNLLVNQFCLIGFYFLFLLLILKLLKVGLTNLKILDNIFLYQVFIFFSVFTVIYFIFEKTNLINVDFILVDYYTNIIYFFLLPIELIFVSIIEELFFRKFMFDKLFNYTSSIKIFFSSILFSFSHFPNTFANFILLLISSLIYGFIYVKTRKIEYSIALHLTTNLSIVFFGLHSESDFSKVLITNNQIDLFNIKSSDLIVLISEVIILLYFIKKTFNEPKFRSH